MNVTSRVIDFKYNPGFKEDRELQDDFIVRKRELRLLLDVIEGNTGASSNRHVLLIGPRGAGKTTLVRRIQSELRLNQNLSLDWFPITFGEESYSITSAGEFWLECIYHLQRSLDSAELEARYNVLRDELDNDKLLDAAVSTIIDQARVLKRRFLVIVENLNVLLEQQMSERDAWAFRHALQNHSEIMLLATATSSFTQIESEEMALFDQFKIHYVGPLSVKDCRLLWFRVSGDRLRDQQVRPIQILTGGNPRLIRILAEFALDNVFYHLVNKLAFMIDQYTDYFKSQLDLLPAGERKVFVALLELWDPAITREVARVARVTTNTAGAYLDRLERRGAVTKEEGRWQASERLFNIYYLMRRRGAPSSRVQALVRFMTVYYAPEQLANRVRELAAEACHLKPTERQDHYYAVSALVTQFAPGERSKVVSAIPKDFFQGPGVPDPIRKLQSLTEKETEAPVVVAKGRKGPIVLRSDIEQLEAIVLLLKEGELEKAEEQATRFVETSGGSLPSLYAMAVLSDAMGREPQAEEWVRRAISANPQHTLSWRLLANLLIDQERPREAIDAALELTRLDGKSASHWVLLARAYEDANDDIDRIAAAYAKAIEVGGDQDVALAGLARVEAEQGHLDKASALFERAIKLETVELSTLGQYGDFLAEELEDEASAEMVFRRMTERFPEDPRGWTRLSMHVGANFSRREEARDLIEKAVALPGARAMAWVWLAELVNMAGDTTAAEKAWRNAIELDPEAAGLWIMFAKFLARNDLGAEAERAVLRAIEIDPDNSDAWELLGQLLCEHAERSKEAEAAFLNAMKHAPASCSPVHSLGQFYESQGRYADADEAYRRALSLRPECGCALDSMLSERSGFGRDLPDAQGLIERLLEKYPDSPRARLVSARFERFANQDLARAKSEILLALQTGEANREIWSQAAEILFETLGQAREAVIEMLQLVDQFEPCEHMLNYTAWKLHGKYGGNAGVLALALAERANAMNPGNWQIVHTLIAIQADLQNWDEALALLPELLIDFDDADLGGLIDVLIELVRGNTELAPHILAEIEVAKKGEQLEPLVAALRILTGQKVRTAKEIHEVAMDILGRIQEQKILN